MSDVVIRSARQEDLPKVVVINRKELPENYPYSFFEFILKLNPDVFLVAEKDGEIVGYLMAHVERGKSLINIYEDLPKEVKEGPTIHLLSIAVLSDYQGIGIGTKLLRELIERAKEKGVKYIYLEVRVSNKKAINLYEKMGFEKYKRIPMYYMDGEDAYLMIKKLEED